MKAYNANGIAWVFEQALAHAGRLYGAEAEAEREAIRKIRKGLEGYLGVSLRPPVKRPSQRKPRGVLP